MTVIETDVFRYVERQLYSYKDNLNRLQELREGVLHSSPRPEMEGRPMTHKSDPTALRGIKLAEISGSREAQWVDIITEILKRLPSDQRRLVELRYFKGHRRLPVWEELHISRSLFYAWNERVITLLVLLATQRSLLAPIKPLD